MFRNKQERKQERTKNCDFTAVDRLFIIIASTLIVVSGNMKPLPSSVWRQRHLRCGKQRHSISKTHHKTYQTTKLPLLHRTFSTAPTGAHQITIRQGIRPSTVDQSEAHASHIHRSFQSNSVLPQRPHVTQSRIFFH